MVAEEIEGRVSLRRWLTLRGARNAATPERHLKVVLAVEPPSISGILTMLSSSVDFTITKLAEVLGTEADAISSVLSRLADAGVVCKVNAEIGDLAVWKLAPAYANEHAAIRRAVEEGIEVNAPLLPAARLSVAPKP